MKKYISVRKIWTNTFNLVYSVSFGLLFIPSFLSEATCKNSNKCFSGNSITIPSSDATPPTTILDVHRPNQPLMTVTSGSADDSASINGNDTVTLIAKGTDPEGLKDIQIWVEETWWIPAQQGPGLLGAPEVHNLDNGSPGGTGCTERVASLNVYIQKRRKQSVRYRIRTWATAVNFGGMQVKSPVVTLNWP